MCGVSQMFGGCRVVDEQAVVRRYFPVDGAGDRIYRGCSSVVTLIEKRETRWVPLRVLLSFLYMESWTTCSILYTLLSPLSFIVRLEFTAIFCIIYCEFTVM